MRTVRAGLMALVMIMGSVAMFVPSVGAIDVGCQDMGANGAVVAVPAAGIAGFGWTPDCLVIDNGSAVTFAQADAIGHTVQSNGCFLTGRLTTAPAAIEFAVDEDGIVTANGAECDAGAVMPRTATRAFDFSGTPEPVIEVSDTEAIVYFICGVHGPLMHGKIVIPR